jgi:hypothetical protein
MKNNFTKLTLVILALGFGLLFIKGCKLKNPVEGIKIIVNADALSAPYEFRVLDAKTGTQANLPDNYKVRVSGPDAALIFSPGGSKAVTVFQGILSFSLRKGLIPSPEKPINFTFHFEGSNYLSQDYSVSLVSSESVAKNITLINPNNLPVGSKSQLSNLNTEPDGKVSNESTISIPSAVGKTESASLTISEGTQAKDNSGSILTGTINAQVIHFTPSAESIASFPGGLSVNEIIDENGEKVKGGDLSPLGWMKIDMEMGGKKVKTLTKPIDIKMEINESELNEATGLPYKEGDTLDLLSLSDGDNNWKREGYSIIYRNIQSGKLEASKSVDHLSWFSRSRRRTWWPIFTPPVCNVAGVTFTNPNTNFTAQVRVDIYNSARNYLFAGYGLTANPGNTAYNLFYASFGALYDVVVTPQGMDPIILDNVSLCGFKPTVAIPLLNDPTKVEFLIKILCENGNQVILPKGYNIYFIRENEYQNTIVPEINGKPAHKIDPADGVVGTEKIFWRASKIDIGTTATETFNLLSFSKSDNYFKTGFSYRFSVYYNDGKTTSREDFITDLYTPEIASLGKYNLDIKIKKCPI